MSKADNGDASSPGLPGELVRSVAERLKEENTDLHRYGYQLALVPEAPGAGEAYPLAPAVEAAAGEGGDDGGRGGDGDGRGEGEGRHADADAGRGDAPGEAEGHWSEVEVQKLPNRELRIRLRGYTDEAASRQERRMADLVRELVRAALL